MVSQMAPNKEWNADRALEIIEEIKVLEGPLLPILHELQEEFGYVPEQALPMIAHALNLSRAEVYGVATFYHDFRREPAGKHVLKLCGAEACQSMGGDHIAACAEKSLGMKIGSTSSDGQVTLEHVYCLGLCAVAPAAMIDGRIVGRLDEARLQGLLAEARK